MNNILVFKNENDLDVVREILDKNGIKLANNYNKYLTLVDKQWDIKYQHNINQLLKLHMELLMMAGDKIYDDLPSKITVNIGVGSEDGEDYHYIDSVNYPYLNNNQYLRELWSYASEYIKDLLDDLRVNGLGSIQTFETEPKNRIKQVF